MIFTATLTERKCQADILERAAEVTVWTRASWVLDAPILRYLTGIALISQADVTSASR